MRPSWSTYFAFKMYAPTPRVPPRRKLQPFSYPCPPFHPHRRQGEITTMCPFPQIFLNFCRSALHLARSVVTTPMLTTPNHASPRSLKRSRMPLCHLSDSSQSSPRPSCRTLSPLTSPRQRAQTTGTPIGRLLRTTCQSYPSRVMPSPPSRQAVPPPPYPTISKHRPRCPWPGCRMGFRRLQNAPPPPDWPRVTGGDSWWPHKHCTCYRKGKMPLP